jgi:signal transduction histidine kinase
VQASGRHLLALINDLLDVSKIEAGKVELVFEAVDCRAVLDEVLATLRPQAELKKLSFTAALPEHPPALLTDRRALCQIILNLAANAIKFTEQGRVDLLVHECQHQGLPALEIRVDDSGVGIPLQDQDKLFGAFSRVNSARPNAPEGTGLGLHLSQKLAELLGGKIVFSSESGRGSSFSLILPTEGPKP